MADKTNETKHTPGPWAIRKHASTAVVGSKGYVVANCGGYSDNTIHPDKMLAEMETNARLIAAAPDLLETLECAPAFPVDVTPESIEEFGRRYESWAVSRRAAIAKAENQ